MLKNDLSAAKLASTRMKFHSDGALNSYYTNYFTSYVKSLLSTQKVKIFQTLLSTSFVNTPSAATPFVTTSVIKDIFRELARVFKTDSRFEHISFLTDSDFENYRVDKKFTFLEFSKYYWSLYTSAPNSIIVLDMPLEDSKVPEPYYYSVDIEAVTAIECDEKGDIKFLEFKNNGNQIRIDAEGYTNGKQTSRHGLGYCPACFLVAPHSRNNLVLRTSIIYDYLGEFDWFLFFHTSKKHLDISGAYPVTVGAELRPKFFEQEAIGYEEVYNAGGLEATRMPEPHPATGAAGAGTFIQIPLPRAGEPTPPDALKIIHVDRAALDYNTEETKRLRNELISSIIGDITAAKQSENELQVHTRFAKRETILGGIASDFEACYIFLVSTICKLRYNTNFRNYTFSLGREYYLRTATDLQNEYEKAKIANVSVTILDMLYEKIVKTTFQNAPILEKRAMLLKSIEPFNHYSLQQVIELYKLQVIDETTLKLKINFSDMVEQFELENGDILLFGALLSYQEQVKLIRETLLNYLKNGENIQNN